MWWIVSGVVLLAVLVGGGLWMLSPTLRTFRGPDFEPTAKDDASVDRAIQTPMVDGGGG